MKTLHITILALVSVAAASASAGDLICCGGKEVYIIDPARPSEKTWTWRAADSPSIPVSFRPRFRSTDDDER